jgi:hypothetical protein
MALPLFYLFKPFLKMYTLKSKYRLAAAISFIHILCMAYNNEISDNLEESWFQTRIMLYAVY